MKSGARRDRAAAGADAAGDQIVVNRPRTESTRFYIRSMYLFGAEVVEF